MPSCHRHLDGPLGTFLSLHVCEVLPALLPLCDEHLQVREHRLDDVRAGKEVRCLAQRAHGIDGDAVDHARLGGVLRRHENALLADSPHLEDDRQDALYATDASRQCELPGQRIVPQIGSADLSRRREQAHRDGKVVDRPLLADIRRGEVHGDVRLDLLETRISDRRRDAVLRLLHRLVGQPNQRELRRPIRRTDLDLDRPCVNATDRPRMTFRQHSPCCSFRCGAPRADGGKNNRVNGSFVVLEKSKMLEVTSSSVKEASRNLDVHGFNRPRAWTDSRNTRRRPCRGMPRGSPTATSRP